MVKEPNREGPTGTSSSRARGSEVSGGSEGDEVLDGGAAQPGGNDTKDRGTEPARVESDQSGTRGSRGRPAR